MRLLTLCLLALATRSLAYSPDDFIHTLGATYWGFWGTTETCANGSYARAFDLKIMEEELFGDNTAVNGIKIHCYCPTQTPPSPLSTFTASGPTSTAATKGISSRVTISRARLTRGAFGDNTATNALRMYWKSQGEDVYLESPGTKCGDWLGPSFCREDMAVCGLMTLLQEDQGVLGDDTTLNDVRVLCYALPAEG